MSKFSTYARRADEIARKALAELVEAENALKAAEAQSKKYPQQTGGQIVDAEYLAQSARAHADKLQAEQRLKTVQRGMDGYKAQIADVKKELAKVLTDEYAADPAAIDTNVMTLLTSGILKSHEYSRLMNGANPTMRRIIATHAKGAAEKLEKEYGPGHPEYRKVMELRAIANEGSADPTGDKLEAFDVVSYAFERCVNNTAMIGNWDTLTSPIVESF